jgi:hypothetical protein
MDLSQRRRGHHDIYGGKFYAGCAQRRLNAGHSVRGAKGHLLRFCKEVVRIAIQNHLTDLVKDVARATRGNQRGTALEKFSHSYQIIRSNHV